MSKSCFELPVLGLIRFRGPYPSYRPVSLSRIAGVDWLVFGVILCIAFVLGVHDIGTRRTEPTGAPIFALVSGAIVGLMCRPTGHPAGHCKRRGYNLTGNTSGTWPECGTPISFKRA